MRTVSASYDPNAEMRDVGVKIQFLGTYSGLSLSTSDIISMKLTEGLDVTGESFPSRSLKIEALDTLGLSFASLETDYVGAEFEAYIGINGEYISVGKFYIDEIDTPDLGLTVSIEASDRVKTYMDKYMTGLYTSASTLMSTLVAHPQGAIYGLDLYCDEGTLQATVFPNMLTTVGSQRDVLLRLAQAAGMASVWVDRDMTTHMEQFGEKSGYSATLTAKGILEYSSLKLGSHTDYVEVSGENEGSEFGASWGTYTRGCLADFLDNDFIDGSFALIVAYRYYIAKNQRFELSLKTRCNPAIEPGDRVLVKKPNGSEIGEFTLASQTIYFDEDGLWANLSLCSGAPGDN